VSVDQNSNVNDESDLQGDKELSPRNFTDAGRQIDWNDEQSESALASISSRVDSDSNAINRINLNPRADGELG
jgi:hypothetical protein